ncbi:putative reverse transcriptase domain-containing protein [Tanacetum coccineum]
MSADSAVTYTSVHSEARSWSIPSEDPYEEAAQQLFEQAPRSPEYVPDPMELEDHVPVYIPEPEHPEDLSRALDVENGEDIASAFYHSLHLSETPPLLPIHAPSTSRRADIPEADTPPRKRLLLTTPRLGCQVGESSAAAAARQPGPTMAHRVDHSHVDTMETRFRDIERRMMTALEMVNIRVSYQVDVRSRESSEFYTRHHDAQKDHAAVRAEIELYHAYPGPGGWSKMAPKRATRSTRATTTTPAPTATTTTTVTNAQLQAMINQGVSAALAARDATRNGTDSHSSGTGVRGSERVAREMFPEESDKIERYVGGLPDMIHGNIVASKPKTMQEAIEMATELMDKRVSTIAERQAENKRKLENTSRNSQNQQQQQNKRQNTGRAYTAGSGDKKPYGGSRPLCSKCNYHHDGPCAPKCYKCNKYGHIARDCTSAGNANNTNNQKGTGSGQKPTCFECGVQGHFQKDCPRLKNNKGNRGNQAGNDRAPAKVYVVGNAGANPDNVVAGTFLLNNRYAYILFDTGADRSFVSTTFSSQIDITPSTLDHYYDVELADGRIIGLNTILKGCTLNFLNHQFDINLMPVELGSFDAIIGMDWLAKYQAVIVCAEKIVRIPWRNKTLISIHVTEVLTGNVNNNDLITSFLHYTLKYMEKRGFPIFSAHVTTKGDEDKSEKEAT